MKLNAKLVLMSCAAMILSANMAHALQQQDPAPSPAPPKRPTPHAATSGFQQPELPISKACPNGKPQVCDVVGKTPPGGKPKYICHCDEVP